MANFVWPAWMAKHPRMCVHWPHEEEVELMNGYAQGMSTWKLSVKHGRTVGEIEGRLGLLLNQCDVQEIRRGRAYDGHTEVNLRYQAESIVKDLTPVDSPKELDGIVIGGLLDRIIELESEVRSIRRIMGDDR